MITFQTFCAFSTTMEKFWISFGQMSRELYQRLCVETVQEPFIDILYSLCAVLDMEPYPTPDLFVKFEEVRCSPSDMMTWYINKMYDYANTLSSVSLRSFIDDYVHALTLSALDMIDV